MEGLANTLKYLIYNYLFFNPEMKSEELFFEAAPNYPNSDGLLGTIILKSKKEVEIENFTGVLRFYHYGPFPQRLETLHSYEFLQQTKLIEGQEYRFPITCHSEISEQYHGNHLKYGIHIELAIRFRNGEFGVSRFLGRDKKNLHNQDALVRRINIPHQKLKYSIPNQKKKFNYHHEGFGWSLPLQLLF